MILRNSNMLLITLLVFSLVMCKDKPIQEPELPIIGSIEGYRNGEKWISNITFFETNNKSTLNLSATSFDLIGRLREKFGVSFIKRKFEKQNLIKRQFGLDDFNEISSNYSKSDYDVLQCFYEVNDEKDNFFQFTNFDRENNTVSGIIQVSLQKEDEQVNCDLPDQLIFEDLKFTVKADPSWFDLD